MRTGQYTVLFRTLATVREDGAKRVKEMRKTNGPRHLHGEAKSMPGPDYDETSDLAMHILSILHNRDGVVVCSCCRASGFTEQDREDLACHEQEVHFTYK